MADDGRRADTHSAAPPTVAEDQQESGPGSAAGALAQEDGAAVREGAIAEPPS